jgi:N-acetylmuramoyl-L-alanine amidase
MLDSYQETITKTEFCRLIDKVYNPSKTVYKYLTLYDDFAEFFEDGGRTNLVFSLQFAQPDEAPQRARKTFRDFRELKSLENPSRQPLKGVRIVLDPGHIGGAWSDIEERSVLYKDLAIIREGDLNLKTAKLIKGRLEKAGALVYVTHEKPEPVTSTRPQDFMEEAKASVFKEHKVDELTAQKKKDFFNRLINWRAELYFYRRAEISQRSDNIRANFLPDLNICNHFNATERSGARELTKDNRHAFFVNGCYGPEEVDNPMTRFYLFSKLLDQSLPIEMAVGDAITEKMLKVAPLPPVKYGKAKYQCRVNQNPYLYARNLAASRQYPGPCVILEPFYMNNPWTAERLGAGDYEGVKVLAGGSYRSLFREYADAVADAVIEVYKKYTVPKIRIKEATEAEAKVGDL